MMSHIEETDRKQQKFLGLFLVAFFLVLSLLTVRYLFGTVFREYQFNSQPIGHLVLAVSVALTITAFIAVVRWGLLTARAKADPELREALIENELTNLHLTQSWKAGFIGAVATPFVFLLISALYPINDLLLVALTTANVGTGAFLTSFYLKESR